MFSIIIAGFGIVCFNPLTAAEPWSDVDIDLQDLGAQNISSEPTAGPWNIELLGDAVGNANVRCPGDSHLNFATAQLDLSVIYYYDPCYTEGLTAGINYMWTRLGWDANPYFSQENFSTATVSFGAFSQRLPNWTWRGQLSINFDNLEYWTFADYMNYDMLVWGRYEIRKDIGVHIGFLALTGMKIDRVYPVIGIDWTYNCNWKLSLVFPVDISLIYTITPAWNISLAGRFLNQRHRVHEDQTLPKALWFYTTGGGELAVNYSPSKRFKANIHAGANLGGHLKIANRHYQHGERYRLESAPYAGAEIDLNF